MKKWILGLVAVVATASASMAQSYIVVNSEKIFKSQSDYNEALTTLDELARQEQENVDKKFSEVETNYNRYMRTKSAMTVAQQQAQEEAILALEQEAIRYQESIFGSEGTLMQKRVELIQPIQKRVFTAIEAYAKQAGVEMVIDASSNPSLLFVGEAVDKTQAIIDCLN